jgi:hypothetical protein
VTAEVEFQFKDENPIELKALLEEASASDVEEVTEEGLLPLVGVVVAAVIAIQALGNVIVKLTRLWSCGIIIDARTATIRTTKDCDLPRGVVLVLTKNDTKHQIYEPSETDIGKLLDGAIGDLSTG